MAKTQIAIIDASKLPVSRRGFSAGGPSISIRDNGQILFSTALVKALSIAEPSPVVVGFESDKRILHFYVGTGIPASIAKEKHMALRYSAKNKSASMNGAGFLHAIMDPATGKAAGGLGYDFRKSGTQVFNGDSIKVLDSAAKHVGLALPEGALMPRPVAPRKPRKPKTATTAAAAGISDQQAVAAAAAPAEGEGAKAGELEFT